MASTTTINPERRGQKAFNSYPMLAPRIWHGMSLAGWTKLIAQNDYDIHHWPMAAMVTLCAAGNSMFSKAQAIAMGKRVAEKELVSDPVFILGHWRTGTTLLHELLSLDDRYAAPTNYQCFAPFHFLITQGIIPKIAKLPAKRPQDNIEMSWSAPQEDEFAICSAGLPSPYSRIAFPNRPARHYDYLTMEGVPFRELEDWKAGLMQFVKNLNYSNDRTIILKSPTHTGRIRVLLDMFPNARFIHLARNPHEFIPSTFHLWRALDDSNALQRPNEKYPLHDHVFESFHRMYASYDRNRELIPDGNLVEIRFEDLTRKTLSTVESIYDRLEMGDFSVAKPKLEQWLDNKKRYTRNQHVPSIELTDRIKTDCATYVQNYCRPGDSVHKKEHAA